MTIIAFANQKGGVAKTTTTVTLGHGLAREGYRVLIVDLDPQGHVAVCLGIAKGPGLFRFIVEGVELPDVVVEARPGLDVITGDKTTERVKRYVSTLDFREAVLIDALTPWVGKRYDFILLDLAPSLDVLHVAALTVADWVLIPTKPDFLAIDGINELALSMGELSRRGHAFAGFRIIPTFFDRTTKETTVNLRQLSDAFGDRVWPPIPRDTKVREATASGMTVWEYAPDSPVVMGYRRNGRRVGGYAEILQRMKESMT